MKISDLKTFMMISWRNMWRQKKRSLVVISSMGLGIFAMIASMGLMNGLNKQMVDNTISTSLGHIAIHEKGFQDNMKLEYKFRATENIISALENNERVEAYTPRVKVMAMVRSAESSRGVMIVGIDPDREKEVSRIYEYMTDKQKGSYFERADEDTIIISTTMADELNLLVGDKLVVMIQDEENEIVGVGLTVRGLYESPIGSYDKFVVYTGIEKIREILGLGNMVSEICVILENKDMVDRQKKALISAIDNDNLEILSWKDMAPNLVSSVELFDQMMYLFFLIVFMTVIFSVANTLIMAIMERFHEIGVMKCIGTRPSRIFFMVVFEAINLGLVGLFSGVVVGVLVVGLFNIIGIDFSFYMESARNMGTGSVIYPIIRATDILKAASIVFITTILAALYPAAKAARIKPLEALHYV